MKKFFAFILGLLVISCSSGYNPPVSPLIKGGSGGVLEKGGSIDGVEKGGSVDVIGKGGSNVINNSTNNKIPLNPPFPSHLTLPSPLAGEGKMGEIIGETKSLTTASITLTVKWPDANLKTNAIPPDTKNIAVTVASSSFQEINETITRTKGAASETKTISDIPVGLTGADVGIIVEAKDTTNNMIGKGGTSLTLMPSYDPQKIYITLKEPAKPPAGTTNVELIPNQVVDTFFPAVVIFNIILDQAGTPLPDPNIANFEVKEDDKICRITNIEVMESATNPFPISVSLVLDRSGSMDGQATYNLNSAATTFVNDLLKGGDKAEIIDFSSSISVTQSLTSDKSLLNSAISNPLQVGGMTALFDAIAKGISELTSINSRSAVIAMTDGGENASVNYKTEDSVINYAKSNKVPVFTIGLFTGTSTFNDEETMKYIAEGREEIDNTTGKIVRIGGTGGTYLNSPTSNDLGTVYRKLADRLSKQIKISFISPDPVVKNKTRTVEVKLINYGTFSGLKQTITYTK